MENAYIEYYLVQTGSGINDIGPLYHNFRFVQRGSGFGSFFGALYNFLKPVIISGAKVLRNQAFKTGKDILLDLGSKPLKDVLQEHGVKAVDELQSKLARKFQSGSGLMFSAAAIKKAQRKRYKRVKSTQKLKQSATKRKKVKTSRKINKKSLRKKTSKKKSTKTRVLDIFQ